MTWSPTHYSRFEDDRTRPVRDLVAGIPATDPARVIDLGCGPGNSTEILLARYPDAAVTALDSSPEMLEAARKRLPNIQFDLADIATWNDGRHYDVILSNAVLQWLPDHATLLPSLVDRLTDGGSLAFQMPQNLDEPAYRAMRAVADRPAWRDKLQAAGGKRAEMGTDAWYYDVLRPHCRRVDMWRTTYYHVMDGADAIVAWFTSSGLRPYLAALDDAERAEYLALYRAEIARDYPALADGTALLPFPRLFLVANR